MTARGAGDGTPGGRRSQARSEATGRGRGRGRGGGAPGGGTGRGGARLRRRDGSGRTDAAERGAAGAVADARGVARLTDAEACTGCGICVDACPRSAIELDELPAIHEDLCTGCGECVEACPRGALALVAA